MTAEEARYSNNSLPISLLFPVYLLLVKILADIHSILMSEQELQEDWPNKATLRYCLLWVLDKNLVAGDRTATDLLDDYKLHITDSTGPVDEDALKIAEKENGPCELKEWLQRRIKKNFESEEMMKKLAHAFGECEMAIQRKRPFQECLGSAGKDFRNALVGKRVKLPYADFLKDKNRARQEFMNSLRLHPESLVRLLNRPQSCPQMPMTGTTANPVTVRSL